MTSKFRSRTSWRAKLEKWQEVRIVPLPRRLAKKAGQGSMLIPQPLAVDALIRETPKGKLVTQSRIRERLAREYGADTTCPTTTGIFVRIAAEAAEEDLRRGEKQLTPWWRVVRDDGSLIASFPGGVKAQATRLKAEGLRIAPRRGKRPPRVKNFERRLVRWERAEARARLPAGEGEPRHSVEREGEESARLAGDEAAGPLGESPEREGPARVGP